jgi:hypothetical protein
MLIGSLIRGAMGGRRKRGRRAARFLTGGGSSFLNASTLLTVAGVAWGLMESAGPKTTVPTGGFGLGSPGATPPVNLPPLPLAGGTASTPSVPDHVLRLVRLTVSAANADGNLSEVERHRILDSAKESGAETVVADELKSPWPLNQIVSGATDPQLKQDLYTLAFTIVHADEGVSGAERIYLAQLALELGLDASTAARLEQQAVERIKQA